MLACCTATNYAEMRLTKQAFQTSALNHIVSVIEMKTTVGMLDWTKNRVAAIGRARLWAELRAMDDNVLKNAGFEPDLLDQGADAWPWQAPAHEGSSSTELPIDDSAAPVSIASADRMRRFSERAVFRSSESDERPEAA